MKYYAYKRIKDGAFVTGTDYSGGVTNTGFRTQLCNKNRPPIMVTDAINDSIDERFKEPRATMIVRLMDPSLYIPVEVDISITGECDIEPIDGVESWSPYNSTNLAKFKAARKTSQAGSDNIIGERTVVKIE